MSCPKCAPQKKRLPWPWLVSLLAVALVAALTYAAS
jgi:hypothetical protein